jgi:hypothetical protein
MDKDSNKQLVQKDVLYYKDLTVDKNGCQVAIMNKSIFYLKLEYWKSNKNLLWFYLDGIGKVDVPLVVNSDVSITQLIDTFMRKE